jgi:hypothetical protein
MKNNKILVKMLFESHLYGLNTPESDVDYKGIFLPDLDDLLLMKAPKHISKSSGNNNSKNTSEDTDDEIYSLHYFVELACKGETAAIDMLHGTETIQSSPEWEFLVQNREKFYTKNMKSYVGYVTRQASKYGIKGSKIEILERIIKILKTCDGHKTLLDVKDLLPETEHSRFTEILGTGAKQEFFKICERKFQLNCKIFYTIDALEKILSGYGERARTARANSGIDWKAVSHALRAGFQAYWIYKNGEFSYPLPETYFLLQVKQGKLDFLTEVQPILEALVKDVEILSLKSELPETVDSEFWHKWVLKVTKERYSIK